MCVITLAISSEKQSGPASVRLFVPSAYSPWLTRGQHSTRPAYISARQYGGPTYLLKWLKSVNNRQQCRKITENEHTQKNSTQQSQWSLGWLVGWEINVPFQHKNRLYRRQGLGWRFSFARLRMANDIVTSRPHCLFVQQQPKMGKDRGGSFQLLH